LELAGKLQRHKESPPGVKDLAERHEAEIASLVDEVLRLRDENAALAVQAAEVCDGGGDESPQREGGLQRQVRSASEELCDEVSRLRRQAAEQQRRGRRALIEQWSLDEVRGEAMQVVKLLKAQQRQLEELQSRHSKAEVYLRQASEAHVKVQKELEHERARVRELHTQASGLREACYLPARLKRESSFLVRMLDQEGGRLKTKKHLQSLQVCKRLYDDIAAQAPSLLPLVGRAKSDMEATFNRYLRLEESHSRTLQRVHLGVTRGCLEEGSHGVSWVG